MVNELNKEKLVFAYIAGIVDGDGAIVALIEKKRIRIEVSLYNNCRNVIDFIKRIYKFGKLYKRKWSIKTNSGSKVVLESLSSYLIVKQRQCKVALQLINEKDLQKQKILAEAINKLNIVAKDVFSISDDFNNNSYLNDL